MNTERMKHKRKNTGKLVAIGVLAVIIIGAGILFLVKKQEAKQQNEQVKGAGQYFGADQNEAKKENAPIVKEHDGITEISLPNPEVIVNKPTVAQLKEFRKQSEELAAQVRQEREKKIVHLRDAAVEVLPLYTFEDQKKGLIGVEFLPENSGALYVFQMDDVGRGFGTKGMKFPLDYVWMNSDLKVVHVTKNVPPEYPENIMSLWPARYVIETNAGFIDANGIQVGDTASFEHIPH